ncbi:MAG TPA: Rrf2 family transcriptional regulator, partial [Phnomibacter sp.]|nr:Rrf2 family transcriptional regulator [Phnomibacter sp.]
MMSKKCKYAIKALVQMAPKYQQGNMLTSDIAAKANIPKKFLEQILLELKYAGYLGSHKGYGGGYYLKKDPTQITVADIYRLFDGAIALVPCVAVYFYDKCDDCPEEATCIYRGKFDMIKERTRGIMQDITIASF